MTLRKGEPDPPLYGNGICDCAENPESNLIVDRVPDKGTGHPIPSFDREFMAMTPAFEGTLGLHVHETTVPFELGNTSDPLCAEGKKREDTKRSLDRRSSCAVFTVSATVGESGAGSRFTAIRTVLADAGFKPGKFSGFEKNSNTCSTRKRHPLLNLKVSGPGTLNFRERILVFR